MRELERQRDQFVVAFGHGVEHQVFEHAQAAPANHLVAVQRLAAGRIDACGIDADQPHAQVGQALDGLGRIGGEIAVPARGRPGVGAHQHALGQVGRDRVFQVLPQQQRALADGVDHAAGTEKGVEVDRAYGRAVGGVMQRRIGMGADMRRQRDGADIDRALRRDRRAPLLAVGRVARKHRAGVVNRRGDVPELLWHGHSTVNRVQAARALSGAGTTARRPAAARPGKARRSAASGGIPR